MIAGKDVSVTSEEWNKYRDYKDTPIKDRPERYTKFWVYGGAIHYQHVNSRHALSPDGMVAMMVKEKLPEVGNGKE